jgi:small neutral amino acid transporter SnatA (MarC family)
MQRIHSTWLDYQIDEMREKVETRASRCNQVAVWAFLCAAVSLCATFHWPLRADALEVAGFGSAVLFAGIGLCTWFFGRVERDVLEVLPSTQLLIRRTKPAAKQHQHS